MPLMIVSLIRVRSLTSATVRPAWWRASARVSPMATPRLHCCAAPHTAPVAECGHPDPSLPHAGRWNHHLRAGPGGFKPGPAGRRRVETALAGGQRLTAHGEQATG